MHRLHWGVEEEEEEEAGMKRHTQAELVEHVLGEACQQS